MDDLYKAKEINTAQLGNSISIGKITDREKFHAAKQILLGIALLYIFTVIAYLFRPSEGIKLLDICITIFPPLATLVLAAYFRDRGN